VGVGSTLVNISTEEAISIISWVASTLNARISRLTSCVRSALSKFRYGLFAVINGFADVTISDVAFLTGTTKARLLIFAVGMRGARLGSTSRLTTFIYINARDAISLITWHTSAADAGIERGAKRVLVTGTILC